MRVCFVSFIWMGTVSRSASRHCCCCCFFTVGLVKQFVQSSVGLIVIFNIYEMYWIFWMVVVPRFRDSVNPTNDWLSCDVHSMQCKRPIPIRHIVTVGCIRKMAGRLRPNRTNIWQCPRHQTNSMKSVRCMSMWLFVWVLCSTRTRLHTLIIGLWG